ncbi:MAG: peptide chain release factor 1 [Proteobacteria bacterium]|nr:peptide chain release factor 1 [Pseudomonadota bacterium]
MFERVAEIEERYSELERSLARPEVVSDPERLKRVGQELAEIRETVETYREWRRLAGEIAENEGLLEDGDPEIRELASAELDELRPRRDESAARLEQLLVPREPRDGKNVVFEIRAGAGGDEAALFAGDLFRMYSRFAEEHGWKLEMLALSETGGGGLKEVAAMIAGRGAYGQLKFESGVHRVQRVPETESQGRIHTSTATVAVLPEAEEADVQIQEKDLRVDVYRSSGPGGQSVNTTDSAVRLTHVPSGLVVICQDEKSQHKNNARALKVLRSRLYELEQERLDRERAAERRGQIGSGDRSERIRTYNFPQNRVTDHRIGLTLHKLDRILEGDLAELIEALAAARRASLLEEGA